MAIWMRSSLAVCISAFLCSGCMHGIRILGIDKFGEKYVKVPKHEYEKKVGKTLAETHDAALKAIDDIPQPVKEDWELDYIMVGLGIEGKVGIANIVTLSARPRIRLYFTKE